MSSDKNTNGKKVSRRQFLKVLAAAAGGAGWLLAEHRDPARLGGLAQGGEQRVYLPYVRGANQARRGVVHVHSSAATNWNGTDPRFFDYVNQDKVDQMVDQGVTGVTGKSSLSDAWRALLPAYRPGQAVAIKVNLVNSTGCSDANRRVNAVIEPVNAIIRGLKRIGVRDSDIWVFEPQRLIPGWFVDGCDYSVRFFDNGCRNTATWTSSDAHAFVAFQPPSSTSAPPPIRISDVLVNAAYLINIPIMKGHRLAGVTLGFKHHFGTIDKPRDLHDYIMKDSSIYRSSYNPLVDIYRNPHVGAKTILTVGDGLFGAPWHDTPPETWSSFGDKLPNSLFFSTDPVAIDCVMADYLAAEPKATISSHSGDYLALAEAAGLGVYERGAPWGRGYHKIDYARIEI